MAGHNPEGPGKKKGDRDTEKEREEPPDVPGSAAEIKGQHGKDYRNAACGKRKDCPTGSHDSTIRGRTCQKKRCLRKENGQNTAAVDSFLFCKPAAEKRSACQEKTEKEAGF
ncbi:MAG: hypothetical protein IKT31_00540 [Firmicutes bacterium]|nr:hypothetical protein [Bacillota bacterium]